LREPQKFSYPASYFLETILQGKATLKYRKNIVMHSRNKCPWCVKCSVQNEITKISDYQFSPRMTKYFKIKFTQNSLKLYYKKHEVCLKGREITIFTIMKCEVHLGVKLYSQMHRYRVEKLDCKVHSFLEQRSSTYQQLVIANNS
jgi:hypothetical protein